MRFFYSLISLILLIMAISTSAFLTPNSYAIYDPLTLPNNKFGIHIINASPDEIDPAREMVNNGGDWGYLTVLIESKDRNEQKWQEFFNRLRKAHLIPIIRLATKPNGGFWEKPYAGEEQAWADFLDKLNWPVKNRYVVIFNEPNHASEWGNSVDPTSYAQTLDKYITTLKSKNDDFFVLNAGFDASAPQKTPAYMDQEIYMKSMNEAVPGIFNKLDGFVSHSYPNPGFIGSVSDTGRGSIKTFEWEIELLKSLGVSKNLPIFITETGWKHSNGINVVTAYPSPLQVATYLKLAFEKVWNNNQILAVTPFLLSYQEAPFDHFSFKKIGVNEYQPQYFALKDLPKVSGTPVQKVKAEFVKGEIFSNVIKGEVYDIDLVFKNTGQSIWNELNVLKLVPDEDAQKLGIEEVEIPADKKIEPNGDFSFRIHFTAPDAGVFVGQLQLMAGDKLVEGGNYDFATEVKDPIFVKVQTQLKWKESSAGNYFLKVTGAIGNKIVDIMLDSSGNSKEVEIKYLLPEYDFSFTLEKPFYKPKTIKKTLHSGVNEINFGELQPDIGSAILNPKALWEILPWSR